MKKKRIQGKKRIIWALLICLVLTQGGCEWTAQTDQEDETPLIRVMMPGSNSAAALARVSEELSKITMERIGCRVELETVRSSEYNKMIQNTLLEKDLADIFVVTDRTILTELVEEHRVARLDRMLQSVPALQEAIESGSWARQQVNGYSYAVPFDNDDIWYWGFVIRAEICDALNIDPQAITGLEELHEALLTVKERYPRMFAAAPDYGSILSFPCFDDLGGGVGGLLYGSEDSGVVNIVETEAFLELCEMMHTWHEEGLISYNTALNVLSRLDWMNTGTVAGSFLKVGPDTVADTAYALEEDLYCVQLSPYYCDDSTGQEGFCISALSVRQELCMSFLELLYSDDQVRQLYAFGVAGEDYFTDSGGYLRAGALKGSADRYFPVSCPLRGSLPACAGAREHVWEPDNVQVSEGYGFIFDETPVKNEVYQCTVVMEKYFDALCSGILSPEEGVAMCVDELKSANMEEVLAEKQRQFAAWN